MDDGTATGAEAPSQPRELSSEERAAEIFRGLTSMGSPSSDEAGDQKQSQPDADAGTEPTETPETPASKAGDTASQPTAEDTPQRREQLSLARTALKRDRWSDEDIAALSPDTLIRMGSLRREQQIEIDRLGNRARDLQEELEELRAEAGIEDEYEDPDLAEIAKQNPDLARRLASKQRQAEEAEVALQRREVEDTLDRGMRDLEGDYPQLADPEVKVRVIDTIGRLANSGAYDNRTVGQDLFNEVLREAIRIEFGEPHINTAQTKLLKQTDDQRSGQMDTGGANSSPESRDPMDFALDELEKGRSPDEINREYNALLASKR